MLLSICWVCPSHGNMSVVLNHKSLQNPSLPCGHDEHTENRAKQIQHCLNDCGLRTVRELQNWPSAHEPIMVCCCIEAMLGSLIHGVTAWGGCYSPGENSQLPSGPSHHAPWVHLSQLESSKETIGGLLVPSCSLISYIFYGESVRIRWNTLIISQRLSMSQTIALAYCTPFAPFCHETLCLHVIAVVISRKAVLDVARAHGHPGSLWFPQVSWEMTWQRWLPPNDKAKHQR